jgi:hypothetical protein
MIKQDIDNILNLHGFRKNIRFQDDKEMNDVYCYEFLIRFLTPYEKWPAFTSGVIDQNGNILVTRRRMSYRQIKSFTKFDLLVLKIRKIIEKSPQNFFIKNMSTQSFLSSLLKESEVPVNVSSGVAQKDIPMLFVKRRNPLTKKEDDKDGRIIKHS